MTDFKFCLVESEAQSARRSRIDRVLALTASAGIQTAAGAILLLIPLLATSEIRTKIPAPAVIWTAPLTELQRQVVRTGSQRQQPAQGPVIKVPTLFQPPRVPQQVYEAPNSDGPGTVEDASSSAPGSASIPGAGPYTPGTALGLNPVPRVAPPPPLPRQKLHRSILEGKLIHRVQPVYPILARQARIETTVELQAVVGTDGTVKELKVLSGHPLFEQATRDAVMQWRYQPTLLNGQAVEVESRITVRYILGR